jgi:hypothetical protein
LIQAQQVALKFRAVKRLDQRFALRNAQAQPTQSRPLDHRGVASAIFYFFLLLAVPSI